MIVFALKLLAMIAVIILVSAFAVFCVAWAIPDLGIGSKSILFTIFVIVQGLVLISLSAR